MDFMDSLHLQKLQEEIEPIISEILNNPQLKEVLRNYSVIEATEIHLNLNTNKLKIRETETKTFQPQEINFAGLEYCPACDCYVRRGEC